MFISWEESLATNIKWIDNQHKIFIKKMDKFLQAACDGKGSIESAAALKDVEDYTNSHFATEERYMLQMDYQNRKQHTSEHLKYRIIFARVKSQYAMEGASNDFIREFQLVIVNWYKNHINKHDKKMANFFKSRNIQ